MNLQHRIDLLIRLGQYILSDELSWQEAREKASYQNGWFIPEFIDRSATAIANNFLQARILQDWTSQYAIPAENKQPRVIGIVMAGNIPLVGFHDMLCVFVTGHKALIKASSKDETLIKHLVEKMIEWNEEVGELLQFSILLKDCDAYIATGSNNSAGYFEYYFKRFPNIIRRNRTSVAVITGEETATELSSLADDIFLYFGLGCRNTTKIYVPKEYDFVPMINVFKKYDWMADHHKYKNNYDYNLALHILNHNFYMSTPALIFAESPSVFSPISQLNYEFYGNREELLASLSEHKDLQCISGQDFIPFGTSQSPAVHDYADGVDTMEFLSKLA